MAKRSRASQSDRSSHPPLWLVEGLDIVDRRRGMLLAVVAGVVVVGAVLAVVLPGVVPPTAAVGAAIGVAALLLGVAAAVAADATDLIVRGPRHVAAAGGELVAVLPRDPNVVSAGPLAEAIVEVREPGTPLLLGLAAAGRDARRSAVWTDTIGRALVGSGVSVLRVDLASGRSEGPGLLEVVHDDERLARVVELEPGMRLARLAAGRDHAAALGALTELPGKLPQDLDILLVALPSATSRGVVAAAGALDHVLVVAERDRTSRVDLIAGLDALEAAGTQAQVVLLDTVTAVRLAPPVEVADDEPGERRRGLASTVGRSPVVTTGAGAAAAGAAGTGAAGTGADAGGSVGPEADEADEAEGHDPADPEDDGPHLGDDGPTAMGPVAGGSVAAAVTAALGAVPPPRDEESDQAGEPGEPGAGDAAEPDDEVVAGEGADDEVVDEGIAEQRDVDVLDAAAEATALAMTDAESEPLPELLEDLPDPGADDPVTAAGPDSGEGATTAEESGAADEPGAADGSAELTPDFHDDRSEAFEEDVRDEESPLVESVVDLAPEQDTVPAEDPAPWDDGVDTDDRADSDVADRANSDEDDDLDDPTDRLPPIGSDAAEAGFYPAGGADRSRSEDSSDDDLLRTTAQLAMLADDLAQRGDPEPEPEPDRRHRHDEDDGGASGGPDGDHT